MRRKYVFFDVDGTLVSHVGTSHIPGATRRAVTLLRRNGHVPAIATARGAFLTRGVAETLGIDLLVCCSGAHILNGSEVLAEAWLPEEALRLFGEAVAEGHRSAALDDRYVYTNDRDKAMRDYLDNQAGYPCIRPLAEMRRAFLMYSFSPESPFEPLFGKPTGAIALERAQHFIEARPAGTSKWEGIREILRRFGIGAGDVVAFGDGSNDVEMLRHASIGVAVGGAPDAVKAAADLVTDDIDRGGILGACVELGLIDGAKAGEPPEEL